MDPRSSVLARLLRFDVRSLPAEFARELLTLDFEPADHARYEVLSEKASLGGMTVDEEVELNDLLTANNVLMILQSRARKALASQTAA
jgi:hypothetical protein